MKTLAVVCGSPEEFSHWKREAYPIAVRFGCDRTFPVWSMESLGRLRGLQIDDFTCYGTWHLLPDRERIIDRLLDICPVRQGHSINPAFPATRCALIKEEINEKIETSLVTGNGWWTSAFPEAYPGKDDPASDAGTWEMRLPTYGSSYGVSPPGSVIQIEPKASFPPSPREAAVEELTAIARRLSQENLNELVEVAKTIQALHPIKKQEEGEYQFSFKTAHLKCDGTQWWVGDKPVAEWVAGPDDEKSVPVWSPPSIEENS